MTGHDKTEAELAAIGYHAYWEAVGGKAVSGAELPGDLADVDLLQVHVGWKAAARAISQATTRHSMFAPELPPVTVTCMRCGHPLAAKPCGVTEMFTLEEHDCAVMAPTMAAAPPPTRVFGVVDPKQDGPLR